MALILLFTGFPPFLPISFRLLFPQAAAGLSLVECVFADGFSHTAIAVHNDHVAIKF